MDIATHAEVINCVIQDLKDKMFITSVKRHLESLSEEERKNQDVSNTIKLLDTILSRNITEKQEVVYEVNALEYSDTLRANIDDNTNFSKVFKRALISKLNSTAIISNLDPLIKRCSELAESTMLTTGKKSNEALNSLFDQIDELNKIAYKVKMNSDSGNILIIDPRGKSSRSTLGQVLTDMKMAVTNKIKTITPIDGFVGGGFAPKTFNIFGAIGGGGKSLSLQNILLYASKNNDVDLFETSPDMCPCLVYISMELSRKQLFARHLNWCGINISEDEVKNMDEQTVEEMVNKASEENGLNLPIVYIERLQGEYYTTCDEIDSECNNLVNSGFQPVMIAIDYLDRLEVSSSKHKFLGLSGAEGSVLLRQKAKECRDLGFKRNCPVISAAQLGADAQNEINKCEPFLTKVDVLQGTGVGMLATSKSLQTEVETIIFQHVFKIEKKTQDGDTLDSNSFVTFMVVKDRDGVSTYHMSERDRRNEGSYRRQTQKVRNSSVGSLLGDIFKITARPLAVIPMSGFRIDEFDYGRSIRVFYDSDKTDFVSLKDLQASYGYTSINGDDVLDYDDNSFEPEENSRIVVEAVDIPRTTGSKEPMLDQMLNV